MIVTRSEDDAVLTTEDVLLSLCNSVTSVLSAATQTQVRFSGMVQRISKTCLKPDIGCFVLFDGGFSGLVVINFSAAAAMELYQSYMLSMGLSKEDLAISHTSDEVSNVMGELMNQIVGSFTTKVGRELQTHITQNQPKMLALNKQVMLSVDTNLDNPETRRVTSILGRPSSASGRISKPETRSVPSSQRGLRPARCSAMACSASRWRRRHCI